MARTQIFGNSQIEDFTIIDDDVSTIAGIQLSKLGSGNLTLLNQGAVIFKDTEVTPKAVTIEAPTTITTSYTLKWPVAQSSGTQVLTNDGSGNLSWATGSGSGTVNSGTQYQLAYYATSTNAVSTLTNTMGAALALVTDANGLPTTTGNGSTTATEIGYVHGVTSAIQDQFTSTQIYAGLAALLA